MKAFFVALSLTVSMTPAWALGVGDTAPYTCDSKIKVLRLLRYDKVQLGIYDSKGNELHSFSTSCKAAEKLLKKTAVAPQEQTAELGAEGAQ